MKIVFLLGPYYPDMNPVSACIDKYIQVLKHKHEIEIICIQNKFKFNEFSDKKIKIHFISNKLLQIRNYCEYKIEKKEYSLLFKSLRLFVRSLRFITNPFAYHGIKHWIIDAFFEKLNEINTQSPIDVVISTHYPICAQFAGLKFKKIYPQVKWITYFMDPFTYYDEFYRTVVFKKYRMKQNYKKEREIYEVADFNIFTETLYKSALLDFNQPLEKTFCFSFVLTDIRKELSNSIYKSNSNYIKLIYAGCLIKSIRNPEFMLKSICKSNILHLDIYTRGSDCDDIINKYVNDNIHSYAGVNRDKYVYLLCNEYDILINIGNNCELQAPSKLFELISTGLPVINFYYRKDSQYEMIENYPLGLNIKIGEDSQSDVIEQFCIENKGKKLSFTEIELLYPKCTLSYQLNLLENMITQ